MKLSGLTAQPLSGTRKTWHRVRLKKRFDKNLAEQSFKWVNNTPQRHKDTKVKAQPLTANTEHYCSDCYNLFLVGQLIPN